MLLTMFQRKSRLSSSKQGRLIEHFVAGATPRATAEIVEVQANTAIQSYMRLGKLIASKMPSYELTGGIDADES
jgi:transposase